MSIPKFMAMDHRVRLLRNTTVVFVLSFFSALLLAENAGAQKFFAPTNGEVALATSANVTALSCDVMETPGFGGKLMAAAYDSAGYVCIRIWHSSGLGGVLVPPPIPDASTPDVAIAHAKKYTEGQRFMVLVAHSRNNVINVDKYLVNAPGTPGMSYLRRTQAVFTGTSITGKKPRIDLIPDTTLKINGYPSYHEYVVTWITDNKKVYLARGEEAHGAPFTTYSVTNAKSIGGGIDLAVTKNRATGNNLACIGFSDGNGVHYVEFNLTSATTVGTPQTFSTSTTVTDLRIAAMNFYNPSSTVAKWNMIWSEFESSTNRWVTYSYNQRLAKKDPCLDSVMVMGSARKPAIAAGPGKPLGNASLVGNNYYVAGWKHDDTTKFYSQYFDASTGRAISSVDTFVINDTTYTQRTAKLSDTTYYKDTVYVTDTIHNGNGSGGKGNGNNYTIDTTEIRYVDTFSVTIRDSAYTDTAYVGTLLDTNRHFYQINNNNCARGTAPISIAIPSNSGDGLLTAWYDGSTIRYKLISSKIGYKTGSEEDPDNGEDKLLSGFDEETLYDQRGRALKLYPSPAHSFIKIEGAGNAKYVVYNSFGQNVKSGQLTETSTIDVNDLQTGMFLLQVISVETGTVDMLRFEKN